MLIGSQSFHVDLLLPVKLTYKDSANTSNTRSSVDSHIKIASKPLPIVRGTEGRGHFNNSKGGILSALSYLAKFHTVKGILDKEWCKEYKVASISYMLCEIIHMANRNY